MFVGGWTLQAAEAICNAADNRPIDVLKSLAGLMDQSLVRQVAESADEPRFTMLETVREYAREQLETSGEGEAIRRGHMVFFLALAERAEPALWGAQEAAWFSRLEADHDNFRAALQWAIESGEREMGPRLAGALGYFWSRNGYLREALEWLMRALAMVPRGTSSASVRAKALVHAGNILYRLGQYDRARTFQEESLALSREIGDKRGCAEALIVLGYSMLLSGDAAASRAAEESVSLFREVRDKRGIALALHCLSGAIRHQGDLARTRALLEESLALWRQVENGWGIGLALRALGEVAYIEGDHLAARAYLEQGLTRLLDARDPWLVARVLYDLGKVMRRQNHYERAVTLFLEALTHYRNLGHEAGIAECLVGLGNTAMAQGHLQQATRLLGAVDKLCLGFGSALTPVVRNAYERTVTNLQTQLDSSHFTVLWTEGQTMTLDEVIKYTLDSSTS